MLNVKSINILYKKPFGLWKSTPLPKYNEPPKHRNNLKCAPLNKINFQSAWEWLLERIILAVVLDCWKVLHVLTVIWIHYLLKKYFSIFLREYSMFLILKINKYFKFIILNLSYYLNLINFVTVWYTLYLGLNW